MQRGGGGGGGTHQKDVCRLNPKLTFTANTQIESS